MIEKERDSITSFYYFQNTHNGLETKLSLSHLENFRNNFHSVSA